MHKSLAFSKFALLAFSIVFAVACGDAKWRQTEKQNAPAPFTGDPRAERQTVQTRPDDLRPGQTVTIHTPRICGRRIPNLEPCTDKDVPLEKGDKIVVEDPKCKDGFVKGRVTDSNRKDLPPTTVYVPVQYLDPAPKGPTEDDLSADRFFVIQNIATEKLRVYERVSNCLNRLVLETDMVVGLDTPERRTKLGSYTLTEWFKFYEDGKAKYPSWYASEYPQIPQAGADINAWASPLLLPRGKGEVRGMFGWFTAYIEPNSDEQWLHGTFGWGADGDKFIQQIRQSPLDQNPNLTSHGCTRIENKAIAMLREILVPGTRVIRIYAKEQTRSAAPNRDRLGHWDYILTTETADAPRAGRRSVMSRKIPQDLHLESGRYQFKASATAVPLTRTNDNHRNGNSYRISETEFQGTFFVDEGRLTDDYQNPKSLAVGGHPGGHLPSVAYYSRRCEDSLQPQPTPQPTAQPTPQPTAQPTPQPTAQPTPQPTPKPPKHPVRHLD